MKEEYFKLDRRDSILENNKKAKNIMDKPYSVVNRTHHVKIYNATESVTIAKQDYIKLLQK